MTDLPELEFADGLVGFPEARRFVLVQWGDQDSPFSLLRCVELEGLEFLVVPPQVFFPDYHPELDDAAADDLAVTSADDALVLVIVTVGEPLEESTANLLGPLVVNLHTRKGIQAVLAPDRYRTRERLFGTAAVRG